MFTCPVCSYPQLTTEPWTAGSPSDEICPQCGTQFGYDDAIGLNGQNALTERHSELFTKWVDAGSQWSSTRRTPTGHQPPAFEGVPHHLQPDGEFAEQLPKRRAVSRQFLEEYWHFERRCERPLSAQHIEVIDAWMQSQNLDQPDSKATRVFESTMYLRQVAAQAIVENDATAIERLTHAALVMGALDPDPRDQHWRLFHIPWQVADALGGDGQAAVRSESAKHSPGVAEAFDSIARYIGRMRPLEVVAHQPSSIALLEPAWDPSAQVDRMRISAWRTDDPAIADPVWSVDEPAYLPQVEPGSGVTIDDERSAAVDRINTFLFSGTDADAAAAAASSPAVDGLAWAARFWAGPTWRERYPVVAAATASDGIEVPEGLCAVLRHGWAQLTWRVA